MRFTHWPQYLSQLEYRLSKGNQPSTNSEKSRKDGSLFFCFWRARHSMWCGPKFVDRGNISEW